METTKIQKVFNKVYNNMQNPVFCIPVNYGSVGRFIYEIAVTPSMHQLLGNSFDRRPEPKDIWKLLFHAKGMYITILEHRNNEYVKRNDLNGYYETSAELETFINTLG